MRRLVLLLGALLFGCDDPSVTARVLDVLEYGAVQAEAQCSGTLPAGGGCGRPFTLKATLMQDGSSMVSAQAFAIAISQFNKRGDPVQGCGYILNSLNFPICVDIESGDVTFTAADWLVNNCGVSNPMTLDADTHCTGFNLEAFGVE